MNNEYANNVLLCFCMILSISSLMYAQYPKVTPVQTPDLWMMAGIGGGLWYPDSLSSAYSPDDIGGPSIGLCFSLQHQKNRMISLRGIELISLNSSSNVGGIGDVGVLYGFYKKYSGSVLSLSIGLALVLHKGGGLVDAIGIPLELQFFGRSCCFINWGIYGYANINTARPFIGFLICPEFGKIKR